MKKNAALILLMILLILCGCKREYGEFYDPPAGQKRTIFTDKAKIFA